MENTPTPTTQFWAIVELMGHQRIAGFLTEAQIGGSAFIRVDVPDLPERPGYTRFLTSAAIYAINPVTQDVALHTAARIDAKPVDVWDFKQLMHQHIQATGQMLVDAPQPTDLAPKPIDSWDFKQLMHQHIQASGQMLVAAPQPTDLAPDRDHHIPDPFEAAFSLEDKDNNDSDGLDPMDLAYNRQERY